MIPASVYLVGDSTHISSSNVEVTVHSEALSPAVLHDEVVGSVSDTGDGVASSAASALSVDTAGGGGLIC